MFDGIKRVYRNYKYTKKMSTDARFYLDRLEADIIRFTHAIEKGLSIERPRPGFGIAKISHLLDMIIIFANKKTANEECVLMAIATLKEYFLFEDSISFTSDDYENNRKGFNDFLSANRIDYDKIDVSYGGTITIERKESMKKSFSDLVFARHSVRVFSKEPVPLETLKNALRLAQQAPSACNRQAVRVYLVDKNSQRKELYEWLTGVGGFERDVDKYLLITGKVTAYQIYDMNQHIVSAAFYAAYLTLALEEFGVATCVIQRPLFRDDEWINIAKQYQIPEDEQIVLAMALGMKKDTYKVPKSHRYSIDKIFKIIS